MDHNARDNGSSTQALALRLAHLLPSAHMGEAKRRKEAGDKAYFAPKHARDLETRKVQRAIAKFQRHRQMPLPLPGREGKKEGEGFRKEPLSMPLLEAKQKKGPEPKLSRAQRRAKRGARSS